MRQLPGTSCMSEYLHTRHSQTLHTNLQEQEAFPTCLSELLTAGCKVCRRHLTTRLDNLGLDTPHGMPYWYKQVLCRRTEGNDIARTGNTWLTCSSSGISTQHKPSFAPNTALAPDSTAEASSNEAVHLNDIRGKGVHGSRALHVMQHPNVLAAAVHLAQSGPDCRLLLHTLLLLWATRSNWLASCSAAVHFTSCKPVFLLLMQYVLLRAGSACFTLTLCSCFLTPAPMPSITIAGLLCGSCITMTVVLHAIALHKSSLQYTTVNSVVTQQS